MSRVIVHIETDHADPDVAARSVVAALKRGGYDVEDAQVEGETFSAAQIVGNVLNFVENADYVFITAQEPDVRLSHG